MSPSQIDVLSKNDWKRCRHICGVQASCTSLPSAFSTLCYKKIGKKILKKQWHFLQQLFSDLSFQISPRHADHRQVLSTAVLKVVALLYAARRAIGRDAERRAGLSACADICSMAVHVVSSSCHNLVQNLD